MQEKSRLDIILEELYQHKVVYVSKLAAKLYVSECTLRRDILSLEKKGYVRRIHGGATLIEYSGEEIPFFIRSNEFQQEKDVIGNLASLLVCDGQFLMFDQSTTAMHMIPHLRGRKNLTVLTNSPRTALRCTDLLDVQVFCTGGRLNATNLALTGGMSLQNMQTFRPDTLFFSVSAVSPNDGVFAASEENAFMLRQMLDICRKRVLLCDSRKLCRPSFHVICPLAKIDVLVTEKKPDESWLRCLEKANVELIYPENE